MQGLQEHDVDQSGVHTVCMQVTVSRIDGDDDCTKTLHGRCQKVRLNNQSRIHLRSTYLFDQIKHSAIVIIVLGGANDDICLKVEFFHLICWSVVKNRKSFVMSAK